MVDWVKKNEKFKKGSFLFLSTAAMVTNAASLQPHLKPVEDGAAVDHGAGKL